MQEFVSTGTLLSKVIEGNEKFLAESKGDLFIDGVHFAIPKGRKYTLWNVEKMREWARTTVTNEDDEIASDFVEKMKKSLKKV